MEMRHPPDVERYLEVHNSAFPQPWGPRDFEGAILENPSKRITRTFMILERGRAIAAASIGVYRRNPQVGVGHYIGVRPECQRQGIGSWLALYRFHRLAEEGLATVEIETRLRYRASILLHLGLGFRPKPSPDSWNSPQSETPELTRATAAAVRELLAAWGRGESAR
jgi:GNAT superfamily N-acetyltransferase